MVEESSSYTDGASSLGSKALSRSTTPPRIELVDENESTQKGHRNHTGKQSRQGRFQGESAMKRDNMKRGRHEERLSEADMQSRMMMHPYAP